MKYFQFVLFSCPNARYIFTSLKVPKIHSCDWDIMLPLAWISFMSSKIPVYCLFCGVQKFIYNSKAAVTLLPFTPLPKKTATPQTVYTLTLVLTKRWTWEVLSPYFLVIDIASMTSHLEVTNLQEKFISPIVSSVCIFLKEIFYGKWTPHWGKMSQLEGFYQKCYTLIGPGKYHLLDNDIKQSTESYMIHFSNRHWTFDIIPDFSARPDEYFPL